MSDPAPIASDWAGCPACRDGSPAPDVATALRSARHLYVCAGWSTRRVAERCGIERHRLARLLESIGVAIPPRGAGRRRPTTFTEPDRFAELLTQLYVEQRLPSTRIAAMLGLPVSRVRARLAEFGIRRRSTGPYNREDRAEIDPDLLQQLAIRADLPALEISALVDSSYQQVLRSVHTRGIPIRLGGTPSRSGAGKIQTIEALYDDPDVGAALAAHEVPIVPAGGALWERFPQPIRLSAALLTALYLDCGLAIAHIELLTGQPAQTIRRHLDRYEITLRPPGGRSPFRRRWHRTHIGRADGQATVAVSS